MKTMAEVLAEHQWYDATTDNEDPAIGCTGCPEWFGSEYALDDGTFPAHQAAALSAAGFGPVREAQAQALRDAADALKPSGVLWWGGEGVFVAEDSYAPPTGSLDHWLRARAAAAEGEG